jgi:hypothetical protein
MARKTLRKCEVCSTKCPLEDLVSMEMTHPSLKAALVARVCPNCQRNLAAYPLIFAENKYVLADLAYRSP